MPREMALLIYLGAALLSMSAGENGTCGAAEQHRMPPVQLVSSVWKQTIAPSASNWANFNSNSNLAQV